jgi:hypothetical protein
LETREDGLEVVQNTLEPSGEALTTAGQKTNGRSILVERL